MTYVRRDARRFTTCFIRERVDSAEPRRFAEVPFVFRSKMFAVPARIADAVLALRCSVHSACVFKSFPDRNGIA